MQSRFDSIFKTLIMSSLIAAGVLWLIGGVMELGVKSPNALLLVYGILMDAAALVILGMLFFIVVLWMKEGKDFELGKAVLSVFLKGVLIFGLVVIGTSIGLFVAVLLNR